MLCKLWRICCAMWGIVMIAAILGPAGEIGSGKTGRQPRAAEPGGWLISLPADKVQKALWLISEREPGKHRENSVEKADEPTVGILHWGLETWAPGCWKHWRESRESDALHSRTKGPAWEGVRGKRVGFGYQEIVLVFLGSSKEKMLLECALAWRVPGNRALHRDLETTLTLSKENSERCTRWRGAKLCYMNQREFIPIRVLLAASNRQTNKVKIIITTLMINPEMSQYQEWSNQ